MVTRSRAADVVRGGLIGVAEAVPGVSGGTIALVTGVYETIIDSAGQLVSAARAAFTDRARASAHLRAVRWRVILPLLVGMVPALLVALLLLGSAIEEHPVPTRALFLGMVAAALAVPVLMLGRRWRVHEVALAVLAAVVAFGLVGLPERSIEPSLPVVFLAAAVAVCALVLPGVSGAFLLEAAGLYVPSADAVRELDLGYIGVFLLGAVTGLAVVVKALQWLLAHHRRITLAVLTGLVVGALRALWPWQSEGGALLAPDRQVGLAAVLTVVGAATVLAVLLRERRSRRPRPDETEAPAPVSGPGDAPGGAE